MSTTSAPFAACPRSLRRPPFAAVLLTIGYLIAAGTASAHQQHAPVTLDELTRSALTIVEGEVDAVSSEWNSSHTQIHTTVRLYVTEYHKGGDTRDVIEVRFLGGTVLDETLAIVGQPQFTVGEKVFLFLRPNWQAADSPVVQMEHGKFTVGPNKAGSGEILTNGAGASYTRSDVVSTILSINAGTRGTGR